MCFSQEMSFGFAALGLLCALYVWNFTTNRRLAVGVFYFFLMEFLQGFQYIFIDDCDNFWNQFLTFLGFVHIAYQPYFTHIINSSLTKSPKWLCRYDTVLRLCLVGGTAILLRHVLAMWGEVAVDGIEDTVGYRFFEKGFFHAGNVNSAFTVWSGAEPNPGSHTTTEWLRGEKLCTFKAKHHLAWSVPLTDVSYYTPSGFIHSFMMFAPFFAMKRSMIIQGIALWMIGPLTAAYITDNLMEQASIWCFFSVSHITLILFLVRNHLNTRWNANVVDTISKRTSIYPGVQNGAQNGKHTNGKVNGKSE